MKLARMISPLLLLAGTSALAQTPGDIALGVPAYGGNGCPAGSAAATLSPDGKSLSILFDNYIVQAGGTSGNTVDRKSCNIAIPVTVPAGYSVSVFKIDYRGFNSLPQGASSQFNVEYFFAGSQGPRFQKAFSGPVNDDFLISNEVVAQTVSWSPCGEDVNLRANTSLMAQTNSAYQQTMATVDSADISAAVVFQLAWRSCGSGPINPGPGPINPNPQPTYPQPQPTYPPNPQPTYPPYPQPQPTYPPYPQPQPTYPPYPQPQPTYPPSTGSCAIDQGYDVYGRLVYNVRDRYGRVLAQELDYNSALRDAQLYDRNGSCSGGYVPTPNPYPRPQPQPVNTCSIAQGRNAYGQTLYRVMNRSGAVLYTTTNYQDAIRAQQTTPACLR